MRRPSGRILEQTNGPNLAVGTQVEPMQRAAGHTDQVARFHFNGQDRRVLRMNVEYAASCNDESDFVLIVPMLAAEFRKHRIEVRGLRIDVDDVRGDVTADAL